VRDARKVDHPAVRILQAKKRGDRCGGNGNSCARCRKCAIAGTAVAEVVLAGSVAGEEIEAGTAAVETVEGAGAIVAVEVARVAAGIEFV
jgi:hypothetical protein